MHLETSDVHSKAWTVHSPVFTLSHFTWINGVQEALDLGELKRKCAYKRIFFSMKTMHHFLSRLQAYKV